MVPSKDRIADWIKKKNKSLQYLQETHLRPKDTQIESEGIGRYFMQMEMKRK